MRVNWTERLEARRGRKLTPDHLLQVASRGARRKTGQACSTPQRWEAPCCKKKKKKRSGGRSAQSSQAIAWAALGQGLWRWGRVWSERGGDTSDKTGSVEWDRWWTIHFPPSCSWICRGDRGGVERMGHYNTFRTGHTYKHSAQTNTERKPEVQNTQIDD